MIVYSVTVKIDLDVHVEWLSWMKNKHIPDVMKTNKFVGHKMYKVLVEDETQGITYNIQYSANAMSDYFDYLNDYAEVLQVEHGLKYKDKFVAFRTLLKEV
jgi:hypothetical protein